MTGAAHNDRRMMTSTERRTRRRRRRPIGVGRANSLLLCALLSAHHVRPSGAFTYRRKDLQLLSPEMICISGVQHRDGSAASSSSTLSVQPCPTTPEEVANFDAVVMDEHGFVRVTLKDIRMRDDGRQRVHREVTDDAYYIDRGGDSRAAGGRGAGINALWNRWFGSGGGGNSGSNGHRYLAEEEDVDDKGQELVPVAASDEALHSTTTPHHLQVYLVALDDYTDLVTKSQCCYELEFGPPFPSWVETEQVGGQERAVMPPECALSSSGGGGKIGGAKSGGGNKATTKDNENEPSSFAHDYRANAPRTGPMQATTAPLVVNAVPSSDEEEDTNEKQPSKKRKKKKNPHNKLGPGVHLVKTLRPEKLGRHMIVISNCAAELETLPSARRMSDQIVRLLAENNTTAAAAPSDKTQSKSKPPAKVRAAGLKAVVSEVEIAFVSKFGELPLSMSGIIPFYGALLAFYSVLAAAWWKRSRAPRPVTAKGKSGKSRWGHSSLTIRDAFGGVLSGIGGDFATVTPRPMLGLQRVLRDLIHLQLLFTAVAFSYYLHLNRTMVDIDVLYSGTAAALVDWSPWSMAVATAHFCTILGSQIVVTLATDGHWLIQQNIRPSTKKVLYGLAGVWFAFFLLYGFLSPRSRGTLLVILGVAWVGFLLVNVRRSLRHLRMLMVGQDNENVIAVGGALVAKRSLYKKMCAIISIYPIVFLVSVLWSINSQQDSWTWISYVLIDLYLFIILLHASIIWMPRPMASQEYVKYAPLEVSVTTNNDKDLWEEGIQENWSGEDAEMEMVFQ